VALTPGTGIGPYEIVGLLGAGGMGEVYRARDPRLRRDVAIKVLPAAVASDPHRLRRFEQEALATASLNHPNILAVYDVGTHDGSPYVVSELLEGQTLRASLEAERCVQQEAGSSSGGAGRLPVDRVLDYATQIVRGLAAAHAKGIVHRDLKPENLFVTADDRLKILDFGLAKLTGAAEAAATTATGTVSGAILGTVGYMAPEQVRGQQVDARADIFSLGAILYEVLAGRRAFAGASASDTLSAILRDEPRSLAQIDRTIPSSLEAVVGRCLAKPPEDRFQSATDLIAALEAVEAKREAARGSWSEGSGKARPWGRLPVMALVAAAIAAVAVLGWYLRGRTIVPTVEAFSIVALPAQVYGAAELRYLTDAIPATLSTYLAQVEGLDTKVSPTSVEFEQVKGDLTRIADAYDVTSCVLSSVTVVGDRLVLNVQLVEPRARRLRWSHEYEAPQAGYLELVRQAAEGLRGALMPAASPIGSTAGLTANSEAELALRRGQHYGNRYNNLHHDADYRIALTSLTRALELDPKLSEAAAEIAYLYLYRQNAGDSAETVMPEAERWAHRALQIEGRTATAWAALVWAEGWQPKASSRKLVEFGLKAAAFGPRCAPCQTSLGTALVGSFTLGLAAELEAARLDPLFLISKVNAAGYLQYLGRAAEGLPLIDQALSLEPDSPLALQQKTVMLVDLGETEEAAALLERLQPHVQEKRLPVFFFILAQHAVLRSRGPADAADAALANILRTSVDSATASFGDLLFVQQEVVPVLARHGMSERALKILAHSASVGAVPPYDWLLLNPHLGPLRSDSRFKDVVTKARAQSDEMMQILRAAQQRRELPGYLESALSDLTKQLRLKGGA